MASREVRWRSAIFFLISLLENSMFLLIVDLNFSNFSALLSCLEDNIFSICLVYFVSIQTIRICLLYSNKSATASESILIFF